MSESETDSELLLPFLPPHITEGVKDRVNDAVKGALGMTKQAYDEWNKRMGWLDDGEETAATATAPLKKKKRASFGGGGRKFFNQRRRPQGAWGRRRSSAPRRFVQKRAPTKSLSEDGPVCGRSGCRG